MRHDWDATNVDVGDALSGLVEEEVVEAPDRAFFAVPFGLLWRPAVHGAFLEGHLLIDHRPHARSPCLAGGRWGRSIWMRRNLEGYRRTGAQIVQGRVNIVHDGLQAPLSPEISRSQDM